MKRKIDSSLVVLGVLLVVAVIVTMLCGCGAQKAEAPQPTAPAPVEADPAAEAIAAYREVLKAAPALEGEHPELEDLTFGYEENIAKFGMHYDLFAVIDVNKDGIPELIAMTFVNKKWTPVSVFTFRDGKAVLLKDPADPESHATFEQMSTASGDYALYLCKADHIHSVWGGDTPIGYQEENHACALVGNGFETAECSLGAGQGAYFPDIAVANTEANRAAM